MANRTFTFVISLVFLALGVCAFVPALNTGVDPADGAGRPVVLHYENLFSHLPMNYGLAAILVGFGASGVVASFKGAAARTYERVLFVTALIAMVLGLCPAPVSTLGGLVPLFGWTDGMFLCVALFTFYFAFFDGPLPPGATQPVFRQ